MLFVVLSPFFPPLFLLLFLFFVVRWDAPAAVDGTSIFFWGFWSIFLFFFVRVLLELLNRLGFPLRPVRFFSFLFFFFVPRRCRPFDDSFWLWSQFY